MKSKDHQRELRKAQGLCSQCATELPDDLYVMCEACRIQKASYGESQWVPGPVARAKEAIRSQRMFMGLHDWMCQQGKREAKQEDYCI